MTMQQTPVILIVDDLPENVSTLFHFLDTHHFEVLVARDGKSALEIVEYQSPHLILLDVMMPGMDGFETCKRLKENQKTQDIPVIFMTALSDTSHKIRGFELGAIDYVTKPFQQEEVLARINIHLTIQNLQQQLKTKNLQLEAQNAELIAQNAKLEQRNAELDAFSYTVAHDLKNPLSEMVSLSDFLLEEHSENLNSQGRQCVQYILKSSEQMIHIINALLLLASISKQEIEMAPLDMNDIICEVQQRLAPMLKESQGEIIVPETWPVALGYAPWVEQIWTNYLSNGLKYGGQPPRLEIGITRQEDEMIRFWVRDNGSGLSQEAMSRLFTPFTRLEQALGKEGHGLGLSIVQRIVEKLGGKVGVESQPGTGSVFYFTLPQGDEKG